MTTATVTDEQARRAGEPGRLARDVRGMDAEIRGYDAEQHEVSGYASTGALDRYNEVILPAAFEGRLPENPAGKIVFAASHIYTSFDESKPTIIGQVRELRLDDRGLWFRAAFNDTPLANEWEAAVRRGDITGVSVGFRGLASEYRDMEVTLPNGEKTSKKIRHFTAVELLEISMTPIPANPEAHIERQFAAREVASATAPLMERMAKLETKLDRVVADLRSGLEEILLTITPTDLAELHVGSQGDVEPEDDAPRQDAETRRQQLVSAFRRVTHK